MEHKLNSVNSAYMISVSALLVVVFFWGLGFVGLVFVEAVPTFIINAVRFIGSSAVITLVFFKRTRKIDFSYLKSGIPAGLMMFGAYVTSTVGIRYTTASRTAFFSCLSALCVPILMLIVFRLRPSKKNILGLLLCILGVYLISMGGSSEFGFNKGDIISLSCSLFSAMEALWIERHIGDKDPVAVSIVELATVGVLSLILIPITGEQLPSDLGLKEIGGLIFLTLGCTAIAFILKNFAQKNIPANRASLILTLEPVWGGISSALILKENMGAAGYIGACIVVLSIIITEYQPKLKASSNT